MLNQKKKFLFILAISYSLLSTSFAFAHHHPAPDDPDQDPNTPPPPPAYHESFEDRFFRQASNNELYLLPEDRPGSDEYYIKEFKGGFHRGQRLVGNMYTDHEYYLRVVDTYNDHVIAVFDGGDRRAIHRFDRLLIDIHEVY